jgi:hypothetical protein
MSRLHGLYEWALIRSYRCTQCNWPFREFALKVRPVTSLAAPRKAQTADD